MGDELLNNIPPKVQKLNVSANINFQKKNRKNYIILK